VFLKDITPWISKGHCKWCQHSECHK
jgi:hypothetical protein